MILSSPEEEKEGEYNRTYTCALVIVLLFLGSE
jgi:hypothetical protein